MSKKEEWELIMKYVNEQLEGQCNRCGNCECHAEGECPGNSVNCCGECDGAAYCIYEITGGVLGDCYE